MGSPDDAVLRVIARVRRRMRVQRAVDFAFSASVAGAGLAAGAAVAYRFSGDAAWIAAGAAALAVFAAAGAAAGMARSPSMVAAALAADERFGLKERLATMVDASSRGLSGELVAAQRRDAVAAAGGRDFSAVRPVVAPEAARYAGVVLVVAFGIVAMPAGPTRGERPTSAAAGALAAAGGALADAVESIDPKDLDPEEARMVDALRRTADEIAGDAREGSAAEALRRIDERIAELEAHRAEAKRLDSLRRALADAAEAIRDAAGESSGASPAPPPGYPGPAAVEIPRGGAAGGGLSPERALAEGAKLYPEYAEVLKRYFSPASRKRAGETRREDA